MKDHLLLFEMTPGFFSANIENPKFQRALFGGCYMIITTFLNGANGNNLVRNL